jgi:nucleotide-binding universal stress UspA family protein
MNTTELLLTTGAVGRPVRHRRPAAVSPLKVLLATDGTAESAAACRFLQHLSLAPGSAIRILSVLDEPPLPGLGVPWETMDDLLEHERGGADEAVEDAEALLSGADVAITTRVREGHPVTEILREAERFDADLVVVGSRGLTGLRGFLLGSVARTVAERCERPVLVARAPRNQLREVIVATDGSVHAENAASFFARFPLPDAAWSTLIHVVRPFRSIPGYLHVELKGMAKAGVELRRKQLALGESLLAATSAKLSGLGRPARTLLRVGNPATEILELAERRHADLVVTGARGASLLQGLLVGSVAERLLREACCSILIVR